MKLYYGQSRSQEFPVPGYYRFETVIRQVAGGAGLFRSGGWWEGRTGPDGAGISL